MAIRENSDNPPGIPLDLFGPTWYNWGSEGKKEPLNLEVEGEMGEFERGTAWIRVKALEEAVAKLPKTADGVPIVPGMYVWLPGQIFFGEVEYVGDGSVLVNEDITWPDNPDGQMGGFAMFHPDDLYSTEEAAQAEDRRAATRSAHDVECERRS